MIALPLEILTKVFVNLSCQELTKISHVCRLWRDIVRCDPSLRMICFKEPSTSYFDDGTEPKSIPDKRDSRIRFHPVIQNISYQMGESLSTVCLCNSDARECRTRCLIDLPVADDFATVPTARSMDIEILPDDTKFPRKARGFPGLTVSVSNPAGIRLIDIFSSIVTESTERCDLASYASRGLTSNQWLSPTWTFHKKAEILGKQKCACTSRLDPNIYVFTYRSYAGVKSITIQDDIVKVKLRTVL
ncbi:hypothetical protein AN958_03997 [Leucoagaricus sp. SymC.cos]|nr:hypothetical protein AN958_03997 [Leucoagaricus sp. SymC.cos]